MIPVYELDAQTNRGKTNFAARAFTARTASSQEARRVARIQAKENADPASAQDCGVFFDPNELI